MASGEKKKTLESIDRLFGENKVEEMPKLLQMLEMLAQNQTPVPPTPPEKEKIVPPNPMAQEQTALMTQYPFRR